MKAIFNKEILDWEDIKLSHSNRGFRYGDGFFESIALINGEPRFLDKHLERLRNGAKILRLQIPEDLDYNNIYTQIKILHAESGVGKSAKVKLYLWREDGGLYSPRGGKSDFLVSIEEYAYLSDTAVWHVGVSENVVNYPSVTSGFKTLNAMKYVVAGIEKVERGFDEIILLDHNGHVSEALSSNLFWKIDQSFFTPPLSTGCIDGIMRNWLMSELKNKGFEVREELIHARDLLTAESIFTTNAMGIRYIMEFNKASYAVDSISKEMLDAIS